MISAICHQLWKTDAVPEAFKEASGQIQQLCKSLGWEYRLWSESDWLRLIEENYQFAMKTYETLAIVQKVHLAKYIIMYHFGGLYADLDVIPTSHIKSWMLSDRKLIIAREKNNYSMGVMMAAPRHNFFKSLIYSVLKHEPASLASVFKHYDAISRTGKLQFKAHVQRLDKSDGTVHIQSQEQPLVSRIAHSMPSTWREWDSYVYDYMELAWQNRDRILVVGGFTVALLILILLVIVLKKQSRAVADPLVL